MKLNRPISMLRGILAGTLVLALGVPVVFSLLPGCESSPSEPVYRNPFDPLGPDGGDPLQARATAKNDTVLIQWNQPQGMGITKYIISSFDNPDSGWGEIGSREHTSKPEGEFSHPEVPNKTRWYRVQALAGSDFSITSYAVPDSATTGPRIVVGSGGGTTATRFPDLEITVTRGDMVRIALDSTFTESLVTVPVGAPGVPIEISYDLGPAAGNNETRTIYAASFADDYESVTSVVNIRVEFEPAFAVAGIPDAPPSHPVATRSVDLTIPTEGVLNMRFFAEWADTATTPWVPVSDTYADYLLSDSANPQTIRGQFQGDFGFNSAVEYKVTPDLLTSATFALLLPEDHVTDQSMVKGVSRAIATHMRYSESADFTSAPWISYRDTLEIDLSPEPGRKVVHVQYLNDWTQSGTLSDYLIHITQPAEIVFWTPLEGDVIRGGTTFQVRGSSTVGPQDGLVYFVKFDPGDGTGFVNAEGTSTWSHMWDVPLFAADTPVTIRARAYYGSTPDSLLTVTTDITVTVTQLAVTITSPGDGGNLTGNKKAKFTGTAAGILGGAPLESVAVDIGGDRIPVSGIGNWSAEWDAPLVYADTTLTLTATVLAGGDSATTSIEVNVVRRPITITDPAAGTLVSGDTDVTVAGVIFPDLFSAPVDSVVVDISSDAGDTTVSTAGADIWSAVWHTPVVTANQTARIITEAFAGPGGAVETRADTISVVIKP